MSQLVTRFQFHFVCHMMDWLTGCFTNNKPSPSSQVTIFQGFSNIHFWQLPTFGTLPCHWRHLIDFIISGLYFVIWQLSQTTCLSSEISPPTSALPVRLHFSLVSWRHKNKLGSGVFCKLPSSLFLRQNILWLVKTKMKDIWKSRHISRFPPPPWHNHIWTKAQGRGACGAFLYFIWLYISCPFHGPRWTLASISSAVSAGVCDRKRRGWKLQ